MAEAFAFELKLVDDVSSKAKRAADSLRTVEKNANKAKEALSFGKELERASASLKKLEHDPAGYQKLLKVQKELAEQRKKLAQKAGVGKESFTEALGKKFNLGMITSAAFAGDLLAEGAMKIGEGLIEAAHKVIEVFSEGIKSAFEESGKEETRRLAFRLSLGKEGGKESLEDITRFSKLTGFSRGETASMFLPLRRAGFSQQGARTAFAAAADIEAAGGVSAAEALDTFTNIKLKGGIAEKRLIGLGVNAPDFYKSLAKKLGVGVDAAKQRAEGGKLDPQLLLNTIFEGVERQQGGKLGTGAIAASGTFEKRLKKLQALPGEYLEKLVDSPGFQKVSDAFGKLLDKLDPDGPRGQRIMASLESMFDKIIGWFDDLTSDEGINKLSDGVESVVGGLEKAVSVVTTFVDLLRKAAGVAETVAKPLASAMEVGDRILDWSHGGTPAVATPDVNENSPIWKKARAAAAAAVIHAPITVHVVAAPGEDPTHTAQKVATTVGRHIHSHFEKAAQGAGAQ